MNNDNNSNNNSLLNLFISLIHPLPQFWSMYSQGLLYSCNSHCLPKWPNVQRRRPPTTTTPTYSSRHASSLPSGDRKWWQCSASRGLTTVSTLRTIRPSSSSWSTCPVRRVRGVREVESFRGGVREGWRGRSSWRRWRRGSSGRTRARSRPGWLRRHPKVKF